jgi:hypothetical protein
MQKTQLQGTNLCMSPWVVIGVVDLYYGNRDRADVIFGMFIASCAMLLLAALHKWYPTCCGTAHTPNEDQARGGDIELAANRRGSHAPAPAPGGPNVEPDRKTCCAVHLERWYVHAMLTVVGLLLMGIVQGGNLLYCLWLIRETQPFTDGHGVPVVMMN